MNHAERKTFTSGSTPQGGKSPDNSNQTYGPVTAAGGRF